MKENTQKILSELATLYPDAKPALEFRSPYELLVAVILSAQCTDERVNKVTAELFRIYNTPEAMLGLSQEELEKYSTIFVATEDGSAGTKGNVMDAIREHKLMAEVIYSCGPKPMLCAVKEFGIENEIETQISMEERMACGIGACLGCVCQSAEVDEHSHVHNKRVCKDGPVFDAREVEL